MPDVIGVSMILKQKTFGKHSFLYPILQRWGYITLGTLDLLNQVFDEW